MPHVQRLRSRLYLITPPQFSLTGGRDNFADTLASALAAGDVACLQLRLKTSDDTAPDDKLIGDAVSVLHPICQAHNVPLILNDRPDLAHALGCDGVHIGQSDMDCMQARQLLGADKIIGVTCHASRHLAMLAGEAGADYVAFGAFYPTTTKPAAKPASPDILHWWQDIMTLPCVAIGGITPDNAAPLIEAGADFLAVANGVWQHKEGAAAAVAAFNRIFDRAQE